MKKLLAVLVAGAFATSAFAVEASATTTHEVKVATHTAASSTKHNKKHRKSHKKAAHTASAA